MPKNKDLKRLIRARMQKTGESYTAARTRVLVKNTPSEAQLSKLAGMSTKAVRAASGKSWRHWVEALDGADAISMKHKDIAKHIHSTYDVSGWWAQMITVAYERIRGLRDIGQRCDGSFNANKSKTFPVPISELYRAFSVKATRSRWLPGVDMTIRTASVDKSMRITWPDQTSVHLYFTAKGAGKSQVAIQHTELKEKADIASRKEFWAERLAALGQILSAGTAKRGRKASSRRRADLSGAV